MSCCVVGCTNRYDKYNKTRKFYRIPSTRTPFKANKRRLWLQAIRRSDWTEQKIKNATICSEHFTSGRASDDFDSPDFFPSIFPDPTQTGKGGYAKVDRTLIPLKACDAQHQDVEGEHYSYARKMDQQPNVHFSIRKGLSFPPLEKCTTCCPAGLYHCPYCLPTFFKPAKRSRVLVHLDNHLRRAYYFGEYTIHKCGLECRRQPHFHCLYCEGTFMKKETITSHVSACQEGQRQLINPKVLRLSTVAPQRLEISKLTPEESLIPSSYKEIFDDNEEDDLAIIPDSGEENGHEGSSIHSLTRIVSRSNTPGTMGWMSARPDSSKRDQMVQTNIEKPQDCDEYYFMNLVKMFKRLCPKKKAEVRTKIERILFEAEFQ